MTMISWTGKGIYIPSLLIFSTALLRLLGEGTFNNALSFSVALLFTAIFSWLIGKKNNKTTPQHTLLSIPMEHWGIILGLFGVLGVLATIL